MVTGYEHDMYFDITQIRKAVQAIARNLESIADSLEKKK